MEVTYLHKTEPYAHQAEAFNKLYGKEYFALFMEQGTGKTKTLIDIATNLYAEKKINAVLLFAPNRVHKQWAVEQLPEHSPIDYDIFVWENQKSKAALYDLQVFTTSPEDNEPLKWFCVNIESMSTKTHIKLFREFVKTHKCLVCVDEATKIKSPEAARTINITQGLSEIKMIRDTVISCEPYAKYRAILTGMMVTNSPNDIWSMYEFLKHNFFGRTFYSFKQYFGIQRRDKNSQGKEEKVYTRNLALREINQVRALLSEGMRVDVIAASYGLNISDIYFIKNNPELKVPYKNLPELKEKIKDTCYMVRKKDCLDLPEQIYEKVYVQLNDDQVRVYNDLIDDMYSEYNDKELSVVNKLTLILRLQQITGGFFPHIDSTGKPVGEPLGTKNPKIEVLLDTLEETSDLPVLIFSRFKNEVKLAFDVITKRRPDLVVAMVTGDIASKKNDEVIAKFKAGEIDVLIAITSMLSLGQNFQKVCHTTFYLSNDYSLETRKQSEDRTHRSGQKDKVIYLDMIAEGSVDEKVYKVLHNKEDLLDYMYSKSVLEFIGGKL